jgi:hypothetical protein
VLFVTDRFASRAAPWNTEIQLAVAKGEAPASRSRRLSFSDARDDHPSFGPASRVIVWSRSEQGRSEVVSAGIRSGHGGLLLGTPAVIEAAGPGFAAPLAWSPDGRALVVGRGNPLAPVDAIALDLATERRTDLGPALPSAGAAGFDADGGFVAIAASRRAHVAGLLPEPLGLLLAPIASQRSVETPSFRGTGVRIGEPWAPGAELELGEIAEWGEPTGVALDAAGKTLILGQRRATSNAVEERLLEIALDCAT